MVNTNGLCKPLPKEVWIGWFSSAVEAYNMAIYSFVAPLLATLIFQKSAADNALFFSYFLVFIGSCLLYPAGAMYYGLIGDRQGRQSTCIYATFGLGIATGLMGLVPFHFLGGNAWICFLILICAQQFFSGGEYHGSVVFSLEHSGEKRSGLMSSLSCLFAVFGLVAANGLASVSLLTGEELWIRACFLVGAVGGGVSYVLKNYCRETPAFADIPRASLKGVDWSGFLKSNRTTIATVVSIWAFFIVSYSFIFIFLPLVHVDQTAASTSTQHFDTFKSLIAYGLLLVAAGFVADRAGVQKTMNAGIWLFLIALVPLCYYCDNLFVLQMALTFCVSFVIGPIHGWMLQQFDVQKRCRGIFISSAIATSIFGGSTVPICLLIYEKTDSLIWCCTYPLAIAFAALVCLNFYRKPREVMSCLKQNG